MENELSVREPKMHVEGWEFQHLAAFLNIDLHCLPLQKSAYIVTSSVLNNSVRILYGFAFLLNKYDYGDLLLHVILTTFHLTQKYVAKNLNYLHATREISYRIFGLRELIQLPVTRMIFYSVVNVCG